MMRFFGMGPWMHGWFFPFFGLIRLAFWVAIIVLLVHLFRNSARQGLFKSGGQVAPLDILKERYAKGEIDEETFEAMKKKLNEP